MKNEELFITVILGTARKDRSSEAAAIYVLKAVRGMGIKSKLC